MPKFKVELQEVVNKYSGDTPKKLTTCVKAEDYFGASEKARYITERKVGTPFSVRVVKEFDADYTGSGKSDIQEYGKDNWFEKEIVAFDVETTGLNPEEDRIVQFGMARYDFEGGKDFEKLDSFFVNNEGVECDFDAQEVHGIDPEVYRDAPSFEDQFFEHIVDYFGEDTIWVAHNKAFDWSFLMTHLRDFNYPDPVPRCLCSFKLAENTLDMESYGLADICDNLGVTLDDHHDASADALACGQAFIKMCRMNEYTRKARSLRDFFAVFDNFQSGRDIKP